jgi:hypothetical protein
MAISYPLSLPTTPGFQKTKLTMNNIVGVSRSPFTGQQEVYQWAGEGFLADVSLPPMKRVQAQKWVTLLAALRGQLGTLYIGDDQATAPRGVATGTPLVHGAQSAMSNTLATKGWTHGVTGILLAGDYIQLGTGAQQRIYQVLTDVNSDGSGLATLDIFPTLREGVSDNQPITLSNPMGTFRLVKNDRTWDVDAASIYGIEFQCEEAY